MEIDYDEEGEQMEMADESQSVDDSDDDIEMNTEVSHSISLQSCASLRSEEHTSELQSR